MSGEVAGRETSSGGASAVEFIGGDLIDAVSVGGESLHIGEEPIGGEVTSGMTTSEEALRNLEVRIQHRAPTTLSSDVSSPKRAPIHQDEHVLFHCNEHRTPNALSERSR